MRFLSQIIEFEQRYADNRALTLLHVVPGALFLLAPVKAIGVIRRGDVVHHREWMIRMFAVGIGIAVVTVVGGPTIALVGLTFWAGWGLSVTIAELWIRSTRLSRVAGPANVEAGFSPPTAA